MLIFAHWFADANQVCNVLSHPDSEAAASSLSVTEFNRVSLQYHIGESRTITAGKESSDHPSAGTTSSRRLYKFSLLQLPLKQGHNYENLPTTQALLAVLIPILYI